MNIYATWLEDEKTFLIPFYAENEKAAKKEEKRYHNSKVYKVAEFNEKTGEIKGIFKDGGTFI